MGDDNLPMGPWSDEEVLADPWSVVVDALLYQRAGASLPDELNTAADHAGMVLTAMALRRVGYTIDALDALWDREPMEWSFTWVEADESVSVTASWHDGNDPPAVTTTVRGLAGKLNARFIDGQNR